MTSQPDSHAASITVQSVPDARTQFEVAAQEDQPKHVTVLGQSFQLTKKLSLGASVDLDRAQREEDIGGIVDATARLIVKSDRERFKEFMLSDGDDDGDTVDLDTFLEALGAAIEGVAGRPTQPAKS